MSYQISIYDRGESIAYHDGEGDLWLQLGYGRTARLYCSDTQRLPFARRKTVAKNLCDYFGKKSEPLVFILDEADQDRDAFESLFARLRAEGKQVSVELDSAAKREQFEEAMHLQVLRAGKKLRLEGVTFENEADYLEWKRQNRSE